MTIRTLPSAFPTLRARDYFTRRLARAELVRRIAHAQNYLWAHGERIYANCAYEGNGSSLKHDYANQHPAAETIPNGDTGICVASFFVPPNWGASQRLRIQGRVEQTGSGEVADPQTTLVAALYELDGTPLNISAEWRGEAKPGTFDVLLTLTTPGNRNVQCRVFMSLASAAATDATSLKHLSARYETGNATEIGGDTPPTTWKPTAHFADTDHPLSAALLQRLVQNTQALYALRPPEVCQSWLADNHANGGAFTEVGRYRVYVSPRITELKGKLYVYCTHGGAGNEVRVLRDGVVVQTFTALAAGENELAVNAFAPTSAGAENVLTVEARSTAAGGDWGTMVLGVYFWEETIGLDLPAGTTVPAAYQPLDETVLEGDQRIVARLHGTRRAGVYYLQQNDTWLARHRLRWLVGDWRGRRYKRVEVAPSTTIIEPTLDWTRGPDDVAYQLGCPKNITLQGEDDSFNEFDGLALHPNGLATAKGGDEFAGHTWEQQGRRIGRFYIETPAGMTPHGDSVRARLEMAIRGRRLSPFSPSSYTDGAKPGNLGTSVEEPNWKDQGRFASLMGGLESLQLHVKSTPSAADTTPRWHGPKSQLDSIMGSNFDIVGRCPPKSTAQPAPYTAARKEGMLYEMEAQAIYIADMPLPKQDLDDLP